MSVHWLVTRRTHETAEKKGERALPLSPNNLPTIHPTGFSLLISVVTVFVASLIAVITVVTVNGTNAAVLHSIVLDNTELPGRFV